MTIDLAAFWQRLETNFPLGGPRRHLRELLGAELVDTLERIGVLKHQRVADRYPCPKPGSGHGCPRELIEHDDGDIEAVCGNDPSECPDLHLTPRDIEFLAIDGDELCEAVAKVLQVRGSVARLQGVRSAYRVGTFIPEPGIRNAIYLLVRSSEREYAEALDALGSHTEGQPFAVLVPTERFVSEEVRRRALAARAPVVPLSDAVGFDAAGALVALIDPVVLFAGVGRARARAVAPTMVAQALVRGHGRAPAWRDLDDAGYHALVAAAASYHIFGDELKKTVAKTVGRARNVTEKVRASHFQMIRVAVEKRTNFDPSVDGPDDEGVSGKQIFQRARQAFDLKIGDGWAIFKTDTIDNHAVYRFDPDPAVTFALVFAPST